MSRLKCKTPRCKNRPATTGKGKAKRPRKDGLCESCRSRAWRAAHPMRHAYINLKAHAKERGKEFSLTFAEFERFAVDVQYIEKKGRGVDGFHVDRRDETRGYHADNLALIVNPENTRKHARWKASFIRDMHGQKWRANYPDAPARKAKK